MKKVLMISTDRQILDGMSPVALRMREYAEVFGELHIIVFSTTGTDRVELSPKCFVYPTGSSTRYTYIFDGVRIGASIMRNTSSENGDWVITTQDPFETGIVGLFLARKYKVAINVQIHTDFLSPYFTRNSKLNTVRRFLARYVLPRATSIRVVSERIRASLLQITSYKPASSHITVLPIYSEETVIATAPQSDRFPQFDKVVLMVSRLEPEKDIEMALRAFAIAEKSSAKTGLVIAGAGSEEASLMHIAQELGIEDRVIFLGWKNASDLAILRASSDVFLSTSLYEGYGLSLIEAVQAGLPIVSTDVGIAPELLQRDRLAEPGDADAVARLLAEALHHPEGFRVNREAIARVTCLSKDDFMEKLKASLLI